MKVPFKWLKELVNLDLSPEELSQVLSLKAIGTKVVTEDFIELDMKGYNRADLLSMRGVAREVAAITNSSIRFDLEDKMYNLLLSQENVSKLDVIVEKQDLVPVYTLVKIEGIKGSDPSPAEWVNKLSAAGMRSVNVITDITNLIMLEYGQPLHAFDASTIKNEEIIVRTASDGEEIVTLDGKTRALKRFDLLITDSEKAVGIAGVMGGKNSEVSDSTTTILLEAAIFDSVNLRKTATRLGLHSEASKRFQHGLTKTGLLQALSAAIKMFEEYGGKVAGVSIIGNTEDPVKKVELSLEKVNSLIGVELSKDQIEKYLTKLGFKTNLSDYSSSDARSQSAYSSQTMSSNNINWEVEVPYWRLDIEFQEDLIEEIARLYGYDKIPATKLQGELPETIDQSLFKSIHQLKSKLVSLGLTEVQTYSFISSEVLENLGWNNSESLSQLVKLANPISSETTYLRQSIWPNLIEVASKNLRQGFEDIAIFEIGKVYSPIKGELPKEQYFLSILLINQTDNPLSELNAIKDRLFNEINIQVESTSEGGIPEVAKKIFHPNRFIHLKKDGIDIGGLAEIHPKLLDKFGIDKRVALLEVSIEPTSH